MSKYLFRPHCGGIEEAMKGLKEFNSLEAMKQYIYENYSFGDEMSIEDITFEKYGEYPDTRIGWKETYIVCSKGRCGCGWFTTDLSKEESLNIYEAWKRGR